MKHSIFILALSLTVTISFFSCSFGYKLSIVPAPPEVGERAVEYARKYIELGAEYEWGGQDPLPRKIVVDCSGLVIRCYEYAANDYGYTLLFSDTTSYGMKNYSLTITQQDLQPGDLLFMGDGTIDHIALFVKHENGNIYFIDSTLKPEEGINGVTERFYPDGDTRFIACGRMYLEKL